MASDDLWEKGRALRGRLEAMRFTDLLALNPTLEDMRHILHVMAIGHGEGPEQWHVDEVKELLDSQTLEVKLLKDTHAEAGKFRVVLTIDSEHYQLGNDQNTIGAAIRLFRQCGKSGPCKIYDHDGRLTAQFE